jgi:hypothetical protein
MKQEPSIIYDLTIIGGAEIYIKGVRITTIEELEEALKKLDEEKETIRKMFKKPIEEVEEAFDMVFKRLEDGQYKVQLHDILINNLGIKITNLKAMLPTIQS